MSYAAYMNHELTDLEYLVWLRNKMAVAVFGWEALILVQKDMAAVFCNPVNVDLYMDSIDAARTYIDNRLLKEINLLEREIVEEKANPKKMDMDQRLLLLFYSDDPNIYKK
jgi:hypothetical protein